MSYGIGGCVLGCCVWGSRGDRAWCCLIEKWFNWSCWLSSWCTGLDGGVHSGYWGMCFWTGDAVFKCILCVVNICPLRCVCSCDVDWWWFLTVIKKGKLQEPIWAIKIARRRFITISSPVNRTSLQQKYGYSLICYLPDGRRGILQMPKSIENVLIQIR